MGSIDFFKPLFTILEPAPLINLSNIDNFSSEYVWECWETNPGLLGEKQVCYLCAMQTPATIKQLQLIMASFQDPEKPETFVPGPASTVDDKPSNGLFIFVLVDFFKNRMRMQQ